MFIENFDRSTQLSVSALCASLVNPLWGLGFGFRGLGFGVRSSESGVRWALRVASYGANHRHKVKPKFAPTLVLSAPLW